MASETTILAGPSGIVAGATATFEFGASEAGSTFECRLDGGGYSACTSPQTYSNLAPGSHTFRVRATDRAGNTDPTPAERTWRAEQTVFSDGFETGNFSRWSTVQTGADGAAVIVTDVVKTGSYAARLSATVNTNSFAIARSGLVPAQGDVTVEGDFLIEAEGASSANVPIFRLFDAGGTRLVTLYRQNLSSDRIYVGHSAINFLTTGRLPLNSWGRFTLCVITEGAAAGTIALSLNGSEIYRTTSASFGVSTIATVQIGNDTRKQAFRLVADNLSVTVR